MAMFVTFQCSFQEADIFGDTVRTASTRYDCTSFFSEVENGRIREDILRKHHFFGSFLVSGLKLR